MNNNDQDLHLLQIEHLNEIESMCEDCERIVLPANIARIVWDQYRTMVRYFTRRKFHVTYDKKTDSFVMLHDFSIPDIDDPPSLN